MNAASVLAALAAGKKLIRKNWNNSYDFITYICLENDKIVMKNNKTDLVTILNWDLNNDLLANADDVLEYTPKMYYKVVRSDNTSFNSNRYSVRYKVNEWVAPILKGSKLFVFDTLEHAKVFLGTNGTCYFSIYKCEAKNVTLATNRTTTEYMMSIFWENPNDYEYKNDIPVGTLWADEVKLVEKVS